MRDTVRVPVVRAHPPKRNAPPTCVNPSRLATLNSVAALTISETMHIWANHSPRSIRDRFGRWLIALVCVPALIAVPTPGLTFTWGNSTAKSCTQRPGDICRCPAWRKAAGVCCCSKPLVKTASKKPGSCCATPPVTQVASCCRPGGTGPDRPTLQRSVAGKSAKPPRPEWSACPCGDRSGGSFSLVAQPRIVPPTVCLAGLLPVAQADVPVVMDAESVLRRPVTPPPRLRLLSA